MTRAEAYAAYRAASRAAAEVRVIYGWDSSEARAADETLKPHLAALQALIPVGDARCNGVMRTDLYGGNSWRCELADGHDGDHESEDQHWENV